MLVLSRVQPSKVLHSSWKVARLSELFLHSEVTSSWDSTSIPTDRGSLISRVEVGGTVRR